MDKENPNFYKELMKEKQLTKCTYSDLVHKYNLCITSECLRQRFRIYKEKGYVKPVKKYPEIQKEALLDWIEKEYTVSEIFLKTGIHHKLVYKALNKYGLSLKDGRSIKKPRKLISEDLLKSLLDSGKSTKEIAIELDMSWQRTKDYINKMNNKNNQIIDKKPKQETINMLTKSWVHKCS